MMTRLSFFAIAYHGIQSRKPKLLIQEKYIFYAQKILSVLMTFRKLYSLSCDVQEDVAIRRKINFLRNIMSPF